MVRSASVFVLKLHVHSKHLFLVIDTGDGPPHSPPREDVLLKCRACSADRLWGQLLLGLSWLKSCHIQSSALTGATHIRGLSEGGEVPKRSHLGLMQSTYQAIGTPKLPIRGLKPYQASNRVEFPSLPTCFHSLLFIGVSP